MGLKEFGCVDLFCGAGGLTRGFLDEGLEVVGGFDLDPTCKYAYEVNNDVPFHETDVSRLKASRLRKLLSPYRVRIVVGCAPCQPFSAYREGRSQHKDWGLVESFIRLALDVRPNYISMENIPQLRNKKTYTDSLKLLKAAGYCVQDQIADCNSYGVPQSRNRLVMVASLHGRVELIPGPTFLACTPGAKKTVRDTISHLEPIVAGGTSQEDELHRSYGLSPINIERIRASRPGGTWRQWPPELVANCHRRRSGQKSGAMYGRMTWESPAPTVTTQCIFFGSGRFGHPEQERALSLREAALLQTFPEHYAFFPPGRPLQIRTAARLIGNAVPVYLSRVIARSIQDHARQHLFRSETGTRVLGKRRR